VTGVSKGVTVGSLALADHRLVLRVACAGFAGYGATEE
jgi:hypothetical protein